MIMFAFLFILSIFPVCYPLYKIYKREEINAFDLIILFSALYLWLIPAKDFVLEHYFPDLIGHIPTVIALNLYMWTLLIADKMVRKDSIFNVTQALSKLSVLHVSDKFLWLCFIVALFYLYQKTNFSALTEDNIEGNNTWAYGHNMPWYQRFFAISINPALPSLVLITFFMKPTTKFYKILRKFVFMILIAGLLLGGKSFFTFIIVFVLLYLYSNYRKQIKRKHILFTIIGSVFFFFVYFPIAQSFRFYKHYSVIHTTQHDFVSVLTNFINDNGTTYDIDQRIENYQNGRSMNLYNAFDWACTTDFRANGMMTWAVMRYIFPQRMILDGWNEVVGRNMSGGDADVAESIVTWFIVDTGIIIGPILSVLYFAFYIWFILFWGRFYAKYLKSRMLLFLTYSMIIIVCVWIEHNPIQDIKKYYSLWPIVYCLLGFVYYIFKKPALRKK